MNYFFLLCLCVAIDKEHGASKRRGSESHVILVLLITLYASPL